MTSPLLIVIPLASGDLSLTHSLLAHLATHGPIQHHAVLFVADHGLPENAYQPVIDAAKLIFPAGGSLIHTPFALPAYPQAHNLRFETALRHVSSAIKAPFLFLSPRCVPTRKGWLLELESEYGAHANKLPMLGQILTPESHGTAHPLVPATAVYPYDLPKRVLQRLVARRSEDFEKACADLFVPLTHPTRLIWNHALNGSDDLPSPPSVASVVHTAHVREFALAIQQGMKLSPPEKAIVPTASPELSAPVVVRDAGRRVSAFEVISEGMVDHTTVTDPEPGERKTAYYHSGDLGDIIYGLAAIRLAGGGRLLLGPRLLRTPPPANPMRQDQFERFEPLLSAQPYLSKVSFTERYPGTDTAFDLNIFRERWGDKGLRARTGISTLIRMHCHVLGVDEKFHPSDTWLTVPDPIRTGLFTVHRSSRYRAEGDEAFPWPLIVKRYKGRMLFVGLASEHADFQRTFSCRTAFWNCQDFLELARVIAGSLGFIGNQSFPMSLALGLGQRVLQEAWPTSPDCLIPRPNFMRQPIPESALEKWENSPRMETPKGMGVTLYEVKEIKHERIQAFTPRMVSVEPINGLIELGPQLDANGLGDTLAITPLASRLGERAVMCLPPSMERFAPLFDGLCPVRITEDAPRFPNPGKERFIESKLRMFGFECTDGQTAPVVKVSPSDRTKSRLWANKFKGKKPPLIFHASCSKEWAHVRSRPPEWFAPIRAELSKHFTLVDEDSTLPIRTLAARYARVTRYFGVNTGNWHLAVAMGCHCLVVDADECDGYSPFLWRYTIPTCEYVGFDVQNVLAKIPWLIATL